jgi:surface polysaccharide O-acyltransferase-like enzyme
MLKLNKLSATRNTSIDIGRLIGAFLVVCLHTKFPNPTIGAFVGDFAKIAVPFFFMVSGFYLYNEQKELIIEKIKKSIIKVFWIIIEVGIVYTLLRIIKSYIFKIDISNQNFDLVPFILYNDCNFTEHLWYLFAFIYVLIILLLIYKLDLSKYLIYLLPLLIIVHIVFSIWSRTTIVNAGWYELNWLVAGMPYVIIGILVKKHFTTFKTIKSKNLIFVICFLIICLYVEHFIFKRFFGRGPGVISVFLLAVSSFVYLSLNYRVVNVKWENRLANLGLKNSLNIYLYHVLVREVLSLSNMDLTINNSIVIFILSLFLSILINSIKQSLKNKWN